MPKAWIKRFLPARETITQNRSLGVLGKWLHSPNLWHLNRYSVSTAVSIGFFVSFMPVPGHMILAALFAIIVRANLLLAVCAVWINNPFTMLPMYYFGYKLGTIMLHLPVLKFHIELTWHWLAYEFIHIAEPLLVGCFISGLLLGLIGNLGIRLWWRYHVVSAMKKRGHRTH